jgi:hypothetical protein
MTAVVSEGNGLGERHVEAEWTGDRHRDLGDFEGMGQTSSLMVVGKDEDLGLAGQSTKGRGVQNAVAIAFEAGAVRIGLLVDDSPSGAGRSRRQSRQVSVEEVFSLLTLDGPRFAATGPRVGMGDDDGIGRISGHGARPTFGAFGEIVARNVTGVVPESVS